MFPVFVPFRPFYVQNSLMRGLPQQVLQVVDLKEKFSLESVPDLKRFFLESNSPWKWRWWDFQHLPRSSSRFHPSQHLQKKPDWGGLHWRKQADVFILQVLIVSVHKFCKKWTTHPLTGRGRSKNRVLFTFKGSISWLLVLKKRFIQFKNRTCVNVTQDIQNVNKLK